MRFERLSILFLQNEISFYSFPATLPFAEHEDKRIKDPIAS
jgi:hypothetical protein